MSANKKRCIAVLGTACLIGAGIWVSGWEPERSIAALGLFVFSVYLIGGVLYVPDYD